MNIKDNFSVWNASIENKSILRHLLFWNRRSRIEKKLHTPLIISQKCKGILLNNQLVKSILFSTDLALIENNDCDAILAVYSFPPSTKIMKSLIEFSNKPVVCGIGGGITQGRVALKMAIEAEQLGASAVIVNQPFKNSDILKIKKQINIPIISSVSALNFNFKERVESGVSFFHITGGQNTTRIIEHIKENFSDIPFICTAGKLMSNLKEVIDKEVHGVVLTPPSNGDLFKKIMNRYRNI